VDECKPLALGDAVAAEEEATRLQRQYDLHDPAAAAAAAATLGAPDFVGPFCSNDDPYGTTPLVLKMSYKQAGAYTRPLIGST